MQAPEQIQDRLGYLFRQASVPFKDPAFGLALLAGVVAWVILWFTAIPTFSLEKLSMAGVIFFAVVWYPLLEEVLFRGMIQGFLLETPWGGNRLAGLTTANLITSVLFAAAHLLYQPSGWALLVFAPSLMYGFFRDRYGSIYPSVLLHAFYNAGFAGMNILAQ